MVNTLDTIMIGQQGILLSQADQTIPLPANPGDDYIFWLDFANTTTMFQEPAISSAVPRTAVTADADEVGMIYDRGRGANVVTSASDLTCPVLQTSGGVSYVGDGTSTSYQLRTINAKPYFRFTHAAAPVWSVQFCVMVTSADGVAVVLMDSTSNGNSTSKGFRVSRTTGNKLQINVNRGTSGVVVVNSVISTDSVVQNTWYYVSIDVNGVGAATGRLKINNGSVQTFAVAAGIDDIDPTNEMFFNTQQRYGSQVIWRNRILTTDELNNWNGHSNARSSTEFTPIKVWDLDFNDTTKMFSDTGRTTPVTNGDKIRVIDNKITPLVGTLLTRYLSNAVGDSTSPQYDENTLNGYGVGTWDGSDDELSFSERMNLAYGGKFVTFVVFKNEDVSNGSHLFYDGDYWAVTGNSYNGGLGVGVPYSIAHFAGSFVDNATGAPPLKNKTGYNVLVMRRNGTTVDMWTGLKEKETATITYQFNITQMGRYYGGNTDWWLHGKVARITHYNGNFSDEDVENEITNLGIQYNI
jgi:hypothetical protein